MVFNMMSCGGWGNTGFSILGECSMAWFSFAIIFFLAMIARRQCSDGFLAGTGFNLIAAFVFGLGGNVLMTTFFGSARWSLLVGILGVIVGGYVGGMFVDQTDDGGEE